MATIDIDDDELKNLVNRLPGYHEIQAVNRGLNLLVILLVSGLMCRGVMMVVLMAYVGGTVVPVVVRILMVLKLLALQCLLLQLI
jgi:hypothetical protein